MDLKANLSGTVVDDFGGACQGTPSTPTANPQLPLMTGGNWILNNVPVTGVNINSTPQNLEQTTDVVSSGKHLHHLQQGWATLNIVHKSAIPR